MPGFYPVGEYDVAGFTVGIVDKKKMIDGSKICAGDVVLGLPSTGVHSNGFSLARKVLLEHAGLKMDQEIEALGAKLGDVILTPTKIYVKTILELIEKAEIKGMAHITGGGLLENIPRVLPEGCQVQLDTSKWPMLPIFQLIQEKGNVEKREMYRTFNMGIGFVIVVDAENAEKVKAACAAMEQPVYEIGSVVAGDKKVVIDQTCEL
jgi:phosphoribosylformylglycinamidine cyclo-ligase